MTRFLRAAGWTFIGVGLLLFTFLAYQLWGTNLINARTQNQLEVELASRLSEVAPVATQELPASPLAAAPSGATGLDTGEGTSHVAPVPSDEALVLLEEPAPAPGEALGRMVIPKIGLDVVMVEGVGRQDLKKGPGHMPWTPLPGQPGNAVVSGHRTTYGAPFYDLDLLEPGDEIVVETAIGRSVYVVRESIIVKPTDVWVTEPRPGAWLTLTTCNPRFSARERLIVFAEMVEGPNYPYVAALEAERLAELEEDVS
jgi:sortase A